MFPAPLTLLLFCFLFTLPGGQAHKRRRTSEPIEIEDRLESLICRVGEKVKSPHRQCISITCVCSVSSYCDSFGTLLHFQRQKVMHISKAKLLLFQSTSSLESNLEGLAGVLEADLPNYKNKILRILCSV